MGTGTSVLLEDDMGFLKPHTEKIYALLRIVAGLMFMQHGLQKVFGFFGGMPPGVPAFITYGAGLIELVGGALIALGLFCGPVAFIASGEMAFAFFLGHVARSGGNIIPIMNQGELAALYCWLFLYIAAKGAGIWSVDAVRAKSG
jgi:putative oxidoreductase